MTKMDTSLAGRDALRLLDFTPDEIELILQEASKQKAAWQAGVRDAHYKGCAVAVILEKPSLRTRVSFEVGIERMGAQPVILSDSHSAFSRGESIEDTVHVLERYVDAIVIRTYEQQKVERIAQTTDIPVVNALTDDFHPCQGLADLLTIKEHKHTLKDLVVAYVGDGNNMANTYIQAATLCGLELRIATPKGYEPKARVIGECEMLASRTGATLVPTNNPVDAVKGADVVITDTWTSMGSEHEHDRRLKAFSGFTVDGKMMRWAKEDAIFMHCLPAHRGEEVTDDVMDGKQSVIFDEAENRLHAQKALLSLLMADKWSNDAAHAGN
ncbi:MAG: ornithine carbamoyltransferase [Coriobacteriales bacterium]|jgi:ornithine carbamoyltransferase|nr:ornithine carbamoyltransferase [Coriobacteriales bacterium]